MALSQLRRSYPEFQARNTTLIEVGPSASTNARKAFKRYLGNRELEFPYLCDPDWSVHKQYGLHTARSRGEQMQYVSRSVVEMLKSRPFIPPHRVENGKLGSAMQHGLFVVDEAGIIRFTHVDSPTSRYPPPADLLAVLDNLAT